MYAFTYRLNLLYFHNKCSQLLQSKHAIPAADFINFVTSRLSTNLEKGKQKQAAQAIKHVFKVNSRDLTLGKTPTGFGKGGLLQAAEQPSVNSGVLSLYLVSETIEHLFVINFIST